MAQNSKFPFFLSLNIWDRAKHFTVAQKTLSLTFLSLPACSTEKDGGDSARQKSF